MCDFTINEELTIRGYSARLSTTHYTCTCITQKSPWTHILYMAYTFIHTCCFATLASLSTVFFATSPLRLFCMIAAWCSVLVFSTLSVSLMVSSSLCRVFFFSPVRIILLGVKELAASSDTWSGFLSLVLWGTKSGCAPRNNLAKVQW